LAENLRLASKYYVSVLQKRIEIGGKEYLLTGIEPVKRRDETREKGNMITALKEGEARLGAAAARRLVQDGDSTLSIGHSTFRVVESLPVRGTIDDYRVYVNLSDCQRILDRPGQINVIWSFECLHGSSLEDVEAYQEREMAKTLPGFKHISQTDIAQGRYLARVTTSRSLYYLLGIVLVVTISLIAITGLQEVSERRREVGILVSMGAYLAAKNLGRADDILFVGVDDLPGPDGGAKMVMDGILEATFYYPNCGKEAVQTAEKILRGEEVPRTITLETPVITKENAEQFYQP